MSGVSAKNNYTYQDWCCLYFLLYHYYNDNDFELVVCENEKIDFEIFFTKRFYGYQSKGGNSQISAKELNNLFIFFVARVEKINKNNNILFLVFPVNPINSLNYLFEYIRNPNNIKRYCGQVKNYIDNAINDIDVNILNFQYKIKSKDEIENSIFGLARKIMEKIHPHKDLDDFVIDSVINYLKVKIEKISGRKDLSQRVFNKKDLEDFIKRIKIDKKDDKILTKIYEGVECIKEKVLPKSEIEISPPKDLKI